MNNAKRTILAILLSGTLVGIAWLWACSGNRTAHGQHPAPPAGPTASSLGTDVRASASAHASSITRSTGARADNLATQPASSPAAETQPTLNQLCVKMLDQWKPSFHAEKFSYLIEPPYVIAGDLPQAQLRAYRDGTILASQRAFNAMYFKQRPQKPILILLFSNETLYRRLAKDWLGDVDVSPYGYCRHDGIMVMNIATGGGTLVHELFHALVSPDFPAIPRWYNEAMGSLYEQSQFDGNRIKGLPNWRLPALQKAIKAKTVRPLKQVIEDSNFAAADRVGLNYAQARYLALYLQEKGLVQQYYTDFHAAHDAGTDTTGYATLLKTLAPLKEEDLDATWQQWVMTLHFP